MNIYLKQFRDSHQQVVQYLAAGESERIGAEKLRGLLKILPESDEVKSYILEISAAVRCVGILFWKPD